ncbi:MAG: YdcF family protein [Alphaproteobacteria bacterium]|nr:YdcF family protein [Alphaproteobacteria bacterium]
MRIFLKTVTAIFAVLFIGLIALIFYSRQQSNIPDDLRCDNIVVLTGGKNRIKIALDSVHKFHAKSVFISGVHEKTKLRDILAEQDTGNVEIILGHKAKNTHENAKEINSWINTRNINEVIIVTSDYHMFRSVYELKKRNPYLKIYELKVFSNFNKRFLILSLKEFYRMLCICIERLIRR